MKKTVIALLVLALLAAVPAAAAAEEEQQPAEEPLTAEQIAELDRIGAETADEGYRIVLENASGADVTSVTVRKGGDEDWSEELLAEEDVFEDGEKALLCWTPGEDEGALTPYEICLAFGEEEQSVLHMVPLFDMDAAQLLRDEDSGLCYLAYISLNTEKQTDTLPTEQRIAAQAEQQEGGWSFAGTAGGEDDTGGNTTGCIGDGALFY